jgi:UDP-N-acetylglucosamine diphosphorylase/glucosamine-1-phosphate N-acetyltransferase
MQVVLFEDGRHRSFGPLASLRPVFALRCGALPLHEKFQQRRPAWRVSMVPRQGLAEVFGEQFPGRGPSTLGSEPSVLLSARALADDALLRAIESLEGEVVLAAGGVPVGARIETDIRRRVESLRRAAGDLAVLGIPTTVEVPCRLVSQPWDLVKLTPDEIAADAAAGGKLGEIRGSVYPGAHLAGQERISVGEGSTISPGAVIDATSGPVLIGDGVTVMPNAVIIGPAAVGDRSIVRVGAKIYGGTSVGPVCKVGGEVEGTVFQSFSNKQHDGFLGHSYVGSWVNIGASTDNSDLKNNYGSVRVEIDGEVVDTGLMFVGATIGDHTRTAIGTKFNTGTVVGIFCSVLSTGFPPRSIPSFSWGEPGGFVPYDIEKALETARRVMARRGEKLTAATEALVRSVHREERAPESRA